MPLAKLYDVPNRVREVASYGAHCGAAIALAAAQVLSGCDLRHLPPNLFPDRSGDYEHLIEEYFVGTSEVPFSLLAGDIVSRVFPGP